MTEVRLVNYKVDMDDINYKGISLEIMDYCEILDFTDLDIEQGDDILSDSEFKESISKHIYENAVKGKTKGSIQYRVKFIKQN